MGYCVQWDVSQILKGLEQENEHLMRWSLIRPNVCWIGRVN